MDEAFMVRTSNEYTKLTDTGSRRVLTSQPGRRPHKYRIASGSSKSRKARKSEHQITVDNPYNSGLDQTSNNFFKADQDQNLININTREALSRTGEVVNPNQLGERNDLVNLNNSQEQPLKRIDENRKSNKRRNHSSAAPRK